jgi:hypothetical protein
MLRVFGRLPVTDSATRSEGKRPKSLRGGNRGGVCAGGGVGLWGFSVDVGPDPPVWNRVVRDVRGSNRRRRKPLRRLPWNAGVD